MSFQSIFSRISHRDLQVLVPFVLCALVWSASASAFTSTMSTEVAAKYKARRVGNLALGSYKDELVECSALAGIHTWIGDNLNDSGAEVRMKLNSDYWVSVSKAYLALAQQAAGVADLSKEMGVRMRVLAAEYRTLTESPAGTADWANWYNLIDRCDSWRTDKPAQAFFNNGRSSSTQASKSREVAKAPF